MKNEKKGVLPGILIFIQIVLAGCYLFFSWDTKAIHMEKGMYMQAADAMCFDEYTGVLYPVFLNLAKDIFYNDYMMNSGVFLVQLIIVIIAAAIFLNKIGKYNILVLGYFLTFPLVIQSLMDYTPVAFEIAVALLFAGAFFTEKKAVDDYILIFVSLILMILLSKELFVFMALILVLKAVPDVLRSKGNQHIKPDIKSIAVSVSGMIIAIVLYGALTTEGAYNKMPGTIETGFMCNVAAEHLEEDYYFWPENVKAAVPFESLSDIVKAREYSVTELGKIMSETLSYKEMKKAAFGIGKASAFNRSKETINLVMSNFFDYLAFPVTIVSNMYGKGKSMSDVYLLTYKGKNGLFSKAYLIGGLVIFLLMIAVNADRLIVKNEKSLASKVYWGTIVSFVLFIIYVSFVSFNYFDYFRILPFVALIVAEMGTVLLAEKADEAKEDNKVIKKEDGKETKSATKNK